MYTKMSNQSLNERRIAELDENIERNFEIRKRLGKGAYGIVWKAIDRRTSEIVALKKIFDAFRDETDAQRTYREIVFLRAFRSHPNIIRMLDIYKASNNLDFYLVFEYMDSDLHNVIKKGDILKDVHKRFIMYQLLNAVKYMHSGNVVHRDLKPSNILIDTKCRLKVADFGLARTLNFKRRQNEHTNGVSLCENGEIQPILTDYVATRWYRAPEILVASKNYTKGIDLWSLGCILGEMLRQKPLFQGTSTVNQIERIISALPEITARDINAIGATFGSVLLSKKIHRDRRNTLDEMLRNYQSDAVALVKSLLVFNPNARLTAKEAIRHPYVERFRMNSADLELKSDITPQLRDDVRVSVDEYRMKLYDMLQMDMDMDLPAPVERPPERTGGKVKTRSSVPRHVPSVKNNENRACNRHGAGRQNNQRRTAQSNTNSDATNTANTTNTTNTTKTTNAANVSVSKNLHTNQNVNQNQNPIPTQNQKSRSTQNQNQNQNKMNKADQTLNEAHQLSNWRNNNSNQVPPKGYPARRYTCEEARHQGVFLTNPSWEQYVTLNTCAVNNMAAQHMSSHNNNNLILLDQAAQPLAPPLIPQLQQQALRAQMEPDWDQLKVYTLNKELAAVAAVATRSDTSLWNAPVGVHQCVQASASMPDAMSSTQNMWRQQRQQPQPQPQQRQQPSQRPCIWIEAKTIHHDNSNARVMSQSSDYHFPIITATEREREINEAMHKVTRKLEFPDDESTTGLDLNCEQQVLPATHQPHKQRVPAGNANTGVQLSTGTKSQSKAECRYHTEMEADVPTIHSSVRTQNTRQRQKCHRGQANRQSTNSTQQQQQQQQSSQCPERRQEGRRVRNRTRVNKATEATAAAAATAAAIAAAAVTGAAAAAAVTGATAAAVAGQAKRDSHIPRLKANKLEKVAARTGSAPMNPCEQPEAQENNSLQADAHFQMMEEKRVLARQQEEVEKTLQRYKQQQQKEKEMHRIKTNMQREEDEMHRHALEATRRMRAQLNAIEKHETRSGNDEQLTKQHSDMAITYTQQQWEQQRQTQSQVARRRSESSIRPTTQQPNNIPKEKPNLPNEDTNLDNNNWKKSSIVCYKSRINYLENEMEKCKRELVDIVADSQRYLSRCHIRKRQQEDQAQQEMLPESIAGVHRIAIRNNGLSTSTDDTQTLSNNDQIQPAPVPTPDHGSVDSGRYTSCDKGSGEASSESHAATNNMANCSTKTLTQVRGRTCICQPNYDELVPLPEYQSQTQIQSPSEGNPVAAERYFSHLTQMESDKYQKYQEEQLRRQQLRDFLVRRNVECINNNLHMSRTSVSSGSNFNYCTNYDMLANINGAGDGREMHPHTYQHQHQHQHQHQQPQQMEYQLLQNWPTANNDVNYQCHSRQSNVPMNESTLMVDEQEHQRRKMRLHSSSGKHLQQK